MKNYYLQKRNNNNWLFDDFFSDFFAPVTYTKRSGMKTDIKESDSGYDLAIDLPGFDKKDIKVSLEEGYLTIEAKMSDTEGDGRYVHRERMQSCSRSYYVGDEVSKEDVKARYFNGTLNLFVPKKQPKKIEAQSIEIE